MISKKEITKIKKVFAKIQSDFSAGIRKSNGFFRPNLGDLQKKKKSLLKVRPVFHPNSLKFPAKSLMPNLQRGGAMPQFCSLYNAILQSMAQWHPLNTPLNSRTVGPSNMKFGQQFEIIELYVCTKFRGNRSRDFGFRTRKPPRKFGVKSGLSQKRLKYGKKYFAWLYVSRWPFIPTNPLLAAMKFIPFFFLNFVRSSSPKPRHIEI